jgi:micrococcal nuclease
MDWSKIDDAPMFSFEGEEIEAKVVSVYDGDTVKVVFPLSNKLYKWNCRLTGVDTPELRTRCKTEKKYGYEVRDYLRSKILNKVVKLKCGDFDKYGRLLTTIICDDDKCCVNDWLIENKYAFAYDGGTKKSWKEYLENNQTN